MRANQGDTQLEEAALGDTESHTKEKSDDIVSLLAKLVISHDRAIAETKDRNQFAIVLKKQEYKFVYLMDNFLTSEILNYWKINYWE